MAAWHLQLLMKRVPAAPIPPTVADTKAKFYKAFSTPIPSIYNNVILELLVQQHLMRYNTKYQYDPVRGRGRQAASLRPLAART